MSFNYDHHNYLLTKIESFDKNSLKDTSDLINKRGPRTLKELAGEASASSFEHLNISLINPDVLWLLFRTFARGGRLTDEILQRIVEESECRFYEVERYEIRYNMKMTYKGLKYLTELMPNLHYIDISGSNFANAIQTYQHLLSRGKMKEIRTNAFGSVSGSDFYPQLKNLTEVYNWKPSPFFDVMTKRL